MDTYYFVQARKNQKNNSLNFREVNSKDTKNAVNRIYSHMPLQSHRRSNNNDDDDNNNLIPNFFSRRLNYMPSSFGFPEIAEQESQRQASSDVDEIKKKFQLQCEALQRERD